CACSSRRHHKSARRPCCAKIAPSAVPKLPAPTTRASSSLGGDMALRKTVQAVLIVEEEIAIAVKQAVAEALDGRLLVVDREVRQRLAEDLHRIAVLERAIEAHLAALGEGAYPRQVALHLRVDLVQRKGIVLPARAQEPIKIDVRIMDIQ